MLSPEHFTNCNFPKRNNDCKLDHFSLFILILVMKNDVLTGEKASKG